MFTHKIYYGWVIVAASFVTLMVAFGVRLSFSVFFVALVDAFHWERGATSLIYSVSMVVFAVVSMPAGYALDRFGARWTFGTGALLLAIGLALSSRANSLWELTISYGVIAGTGITILGLGPMAGLLARWFVRRRGVAIGITFAGTGLGTLIFTPGAERLISLAGWREAYLVMAAASLATIPLILLLLRTEPAELGLLPDGEPAKPANIPQVKPDAGWTINQVLRSPSFWVLMLAGLGAIGPLRMLTVHQIAALVDGGFDRLYAATVIGVEGMVTAGTFLLFGALSDRYGRARAYLLGSLFLLSAILLLSMLTRGLHPAWLVFYPFLLGFGEGSRASLVTAIASDLFPGKALGTINGAIGATFGAGAAFFPWLAGWIHDNSGSYALAFVLAALAVIFSTVALWLAARRLQNTS